TRKARSIALRQTGKSSKCLYLMTLPRSSQQQPSVVPQGTLFLRQPHLQPPSIIRHSPFSIPHFPSCHLHLPSAICHPPFAIHQQPISDSAPHKLRIQRSRLGDVIGSLDDRPAVGEDGEFIALGGEPEHECVV